MEFELLCVRLGFSEHRTLVHVPAFVDVDRYDNFSAPYEHQTLEFTESMFDWPHKTFFMINSTERENLTAHKTKFLKIRTFLDLSLSDVVFIMLINVNCWHFNIYEQDKVRAQLS